jgi:hypothetical protein
LFVLKRNWAFTAMTKRATVVAEDMRYPCFPKKSQVIDIAMNASSSTKGPEFEGKPLDASDVKVKILFSM